MKNQVSTQFRFYVLRFFELFQKQVLLGLMLAAFAMPIAWSQDDHQHDADELEEQGAEHHESHDDEDHDAHDEGDHDAHGEEDHDSHGEDDEHSHGSHDESESEHDHEQEGASRIEDDMARQVGIDTAIASSAQLHQLTTVFGSLVPGPEQISHVGARFEGMVESVAVTIGDTVEVGDILAKIQSSESLRTYDILAPISGRIIQRHAKTGEVVREEVLFSIANFENVWAELRIYPSAAIFVKEGQPVTILVNNEKRVGQIAHVIPSVDTPYDLARIKLDNSEGTLSPGLMIEAQVETANFQVSLAILVDAVQTLEGRQGVFVKNGEEYIFTPLTLGRRDDSHYEVLDGLDAGDEYVSVNSYLIKADIEKSEAEHEH